MTARLPSLVVPRQAAITVSGGRFGKETLALDMTGQSLADIRAFAIGITVDETDNQAKNGNPPSQVIVDGQSNKPLHLLQKRAVVMFGVAGISAVMTRLETILFAAINRSTEAQTGRLSNRSNWEWRLNGKTITSASSIKSFGVDDWLSYAPVGVVNERGKNYASVVNYSVNSRGEMRGRIKDRRKDKTKIREKTRSTMAVGFIGFTARAIRRSPVFRQFKITSLFWQDGSYEGNQGLPIFYIRLKVPKKNIKGGTYFG